MKKLERLTANITATGNRKSPGRRRSGYNTKVDGQLSPTTPPPVPPKWTQEPNPPPAAPPKRESKPTAVRIRVIECMNLPKADVFYKGDPYLKLCIDGVHKEETSVKNGTQDPVWNESFQMAVPDVIRSTLTMTVLDAYAKQRGGEESAVGNISVALGSLFKDTWKTYRLNLEGAASSSDATLVIQLQPSGYGLEWGDGLSRMVSEESSAREKVMRLETSNRSNLRQQAAGQSLSFSLLYQRNKQDRQPDSPTSNNQPEHHGHTSPHVSETDSDSYSSDHSKSTGKAGRWGHNSFMLAASTVEILRKENMTLKKKLAEVEQKGIGNLQQEREQLQSDAKKMKEENEQTRKQRQEDKKEHEYLQAWIKRMEAEHSQLQKNSLQREDSFEQLLLERTQQLEEAQQETQDRIEDLKQMEAVNRQQANTIKQNSLDIVQLQGKVHEAEETNDDLRQQCATLRSEREAADKEIVKLNETIKVAEESINMSERLLADMKKRVSDTDAALAKARSEVKNLEEVKGHNEKSIEDLKSKYDKIHGELQSATDAHQKLQQEKDAKDRSMAELESRHNVAQTQLESNKKLQQDREVQDNRSISDLQKNHDKAVSELEQLTTAYKKLQQENTVLTDLKKTHEKTQNELQLMITTNNKLQQEKAANDKSLLDLKTNCDKAQLELQQMAASKQKLEEGNTRSILDLKKENSKMQAQIQQANLTVNKKDKSWNRITELEQEVNSHKQKSNLQEKQIKEQEAIIANLKKTVVDAKPKPKEVQLPPIEQSTPTTRPRSDTMKKYGNCIIELDVTIAKATNLRSADMIGKSDPYVVLSFANSGIPENASVKHKTKVINNNLNPEWDESFRIRVNIRDVLRFNLYDSDYDKDDDLGTCTMQVRGVFIETLQQKKTSTSMLAIEDVQNKKECGSLYIHFTLVTISQKPPKQTMANIDRSPNGGSPHSVASITSSPTKSEDGDYQTLSQQYAKLMDQFETLQNSRNQLVTEKQGLVKTLIAMKWKHAAALATASKYKDKVDADESAPPQDKSLLKAYAKLVDQLEDLQNSRNQLVVDKQDLVKKMTIMKVQYATRSNVGKSPQLEDTTSKRATPSQPNDSNEDTEYLKKQYGKVIDQLETLQNSRNQLVTEKEDLLKTITAMKLLSAAKSVRSKEVSPTKASEHEQELQAVKAEVETMRTTWEKIFKDEMLAGQMRELILQEQIARGKLLLEVAKSVEECAAETQWITGELQMETACLSVTTLSEQMEQKQQEVEQLEERSKEAQDKVQQLVASNKELQKKNDELWDKTEELNTALKAATKERTEAQQELKELDWAFTTLTERADTLWEQNRKLECELEEVQLENNLEPTSSKGSSPAQSFHSFDDLSPTISTNRDTPHPTPLPTSTRQPHPSIPNAVQRLQQNWKTIAETTNQQEVNRRNKFVQQQISKLKHEIEGLKLALFYAEQPENSHTFPANGGPLVNKHSVNNHTTTSQHPHTLSNGPPRQQTTSASPTTVNTRTSIGRGHGAIGKAAGFKSKVDRLTELESSALAGGLDLSQYIRQVTDIVLAPSYR